MESTSTMPARTEKNFIFCLKKLRGGITVKNKKPKILSIMDFDMDKGQRIGIDKLELYGFKVAGIDFGRLRPEPGKVDISVSEKKTKWRMPSTGACVSKISIKDNFLFSDLVIGQTTKNGLNIEYAHLTLSVSLFKNGINLENMSYVEYSMKIREVLQYIKSCYGIDLDGSGMKVASMEINTNILLNGSYQTYNRVLRLLLSFHSNHLKKISLHGGKGVQNDMGTFSRGNKSVSVIYYDKLREIQEQKNTEITGCRGILRIELRLKTKKKVAKAFGSNAWKDLDDGIIAKYYHQQIKDTLAGKFEGWKKEREKELEEMILSCRSRNSRTWHCMLMEEIRNRSEKLMLPYILDIGQVKSAFRRLPDKHNNASRALKPFDRDNIDGDVYKNRDMEKVQEILDALAYSFSITKIPAGADVQPEDKRRRKRQRYSPEFKQELIGQHYEGEYKSEICRAYGISSSLLCQWIKKAENSGTIPETGSRKMDEEESDRLLLENRRLKEENDKLLLENRRLREENERLNRRIASLEKGTGFAGEGIRT